jgi:DNA-binding transcriptional regulator YiaG
MTRTRCAFFPRAAIFDSGATPRHAAEASFTVSKYDGLGDGMDALALLLSACGRSKNQAVSREKASMKGHDFKRWRKSLELSQKEAADALGLKRRVVQYYEKGERDGEAVKIPRTVRLACYAIVSGMPDYHGPEKEKRKDRDEERDTGDGDKKGKKKKKKKDRDAG